MNMNFLKPKRESYKYRDKYMRLLKVEYISWFNRKLFKKTIILEDINRG